MLRDCFNALTSIFNASLRPARRLEKNPNLSSDVFSPRFLVIHDTRRRRHHDETELTGWEEIGGPLLDLVDGNVESRGNDAALIQATSKIDDDFAGSVVVDAFEFSDVSVLHHHRQEFNDDFGVGADEDLPLASLLCVVDALEGIGQYIHANHFCCVFERIVLNVTKSYFKQIENSIISFPM